MAVLTHLSMMQTTCIQETLCRSTWLALLRRNVCGGESPLSTPSSLQAGMVEHCRARVALMFGYQVPLLHYTLSVQQVDVLGGALRLPISSSCHHDAFLCAVSSGISAANSVSTTIQTTARTNGSRLWVSISACDYRHVGLDWRIAQPYTVRVSDLSP